MVVNSGVEGLVVVTSVVVGWVPVVLVVRTVVALTVSSSFTPVLIAAFVVGDFSVVVASGAAIDFFVVIAVFLISCSLLFNADVGGLVDCVGVVISSVRTNETDYWALFRQRSCIKLFSSKGEDHCL